MSGYTGTITDASCNVWTILSGQVYINQTLAGTSSNAQEVAYANGVIWYSNGTLWWYWGDAGEWLPTNGQIMGPFSTINTVVSGTAIFCY